MIGTQFILFFFDYVFPFISCQKIFPTLSPKKNNICVTRNKIEIYIFLFYSVSWRPLYVFYVLIYNERINILVFDIHSYYFRTIDEFLFILESDSLSYILEDLNLNKNISHPVITYIANLTHLCITYFLFYCSQNKCLVFSPVSCCHRTFLLFI